MIPKYNTTRTGKTQEQLCFIGAVANSLIIAVTNFSILLYQQLNLLFFLNKTKK